MSALAAALGAGAAMLMASPASAAGLAAPPAAPAAAQTVSVTAHATTRGAISPFSNPLDITCTFTIGAPSVGSGTVHAGAAATCPAAGDGQVTGLAGLTRTMAGAVQIPERTVS